MPDRRFSAWAAVGVGPERAVQIVRDYDGRVFAMSATEARNLSVMLDKAAHQSDERRGRNTESGGSES